MDPVKTAPASGRSSPGAGVTERLVGELAAGIMEGQLAPGQRLVEADLQARYGAGRSSVREALQQLQAQGLVCFAPNRGASVRQLSRTEVSDLFSIRERLEGLGAFLAATHVANDTADKQHVAKLRKTLAAMEKLMLRPDALAYGRLNRELHATLLLLSGNAELLRLVNQLNLPVFQAQFRGFLKPENQRSSHEMHCRIVASVLEGDAPSADALMQRHVRLGLKLVLRWPNENFRAE
jgi:DNA-binding GntR family transcriptional regulator